MTFMRMVVVAIAAPSLMVLACRYSEPEPKVGDKDESPPLPPESPPPSDDSPEPATGEKGVAESAKLPPPPTGACDDRACVATEDCCGGYACGFDPERSRVQRFCLPQ